MTYWFLSAHVDDCELSCGGTMAKFAEEGHLVKHDALSFCGREDLKLEFEMACNVLGVLGQVHNLEVRTFIDDIPPIADMLYKMKDNFDFVFTHSKSDRHTDHKIVGEQSLRVFNKNLFTYLASWNGNNNDNYFIEITPQQLDKKIAALECYKSQAHRPYMQPEFIRAQAIYNGIKCGKRYAEGFRIERLIN